MNLVSIVFAFFAFLLSSQLWGDVSIEVTSPSVPRGDPTFFEATFKLQGITEEDYTTSGKNVRELLQNHFKVQIQKHSENGEDDFARILNFSVAGFSEDLDDGYRENYYEEVYSDYIGKIPASAVLEKQDSKKANLYRTEFNLVFQFTNDTTAPNSPKKLLTDSKIQIKVRYDEEAIKDDIFFTQSTFVADELPIISLSNIHKGIKVTNSSTTSTIATKNGDVAGTPITPKRVNIFAIKNSGSDTYTIPGLVYEEDGADEVSKDCQLTFSGATCQITCADNKVYVDRKKLSSDFISTTVNYKEEWTYTKDLDVGSVYAVFGTFEPDGILYRPDKSEELTNCKAIEITENKTMIELSTGKTSILGNPDCFIATAAYGTNLHKDIDLLRWYRDQILLKYDLGVYLVDKYYKYSPKMASYIEDKPILKSISRGLLWPIVQSVKIYQNQTNNSQVNSPK